MRKFHVRLFCIFFGCLCLRDWVWSGSNKAELQACVMAAFLSLAASSACLFMISVTRSPYSKKHRNALSKTIHTGTNAPKHYLTRMDFLSQSSTKAQSKEYEELYKRYRHVAFDRLDTVYHKSRGIEYSSLALLYSSQVSAAVVSSGEHFLDRFTVRSIALFASMVKTWLADYTMPRNMRNMLVEIFRLIHAITCAW